MCSTSTPVEVGIEIPRWRQHGWLAVACGRGPETDRHIPNLLVEQVLVEVLAASDRRVAGVWSLVRWSMFDVVMFVPPVLGAGRV